MINVEIPGRGMLSLKHLVLDYNGTLAVDGVLLYGVREVLAQLEGMLEIHVITADTFGTVEEQLQGINCIVKIIPDRDQDRVKQRYIEVLRKESVVAIGNGLNDALMLRDAALGIGLIGKEGASMRAMEGALLVCTDILSALGLLINTKRLKATLRV